MTGEDVKSAANGRRKKARVIGALTPRRASSRFAGGIMDINQVQMILVVVKFAVSTAIMCPLAVATYRQTWLGQQ